MHHRNAQGRWGQALPPPLVYINPCLENIRMGYPPISPPDRIFNRILAFKKKQANLSIEELFSRPEFLLHRCEDPCLNFIAHFRILKPVEPFAHQVRALSAVRQLPLIHTAVIDRAAFHTGILCPERFSFHRFASRARFSVVFAPAAGIAADRLDLLRHT